MGSLKNREYRILYSVTGVLLKSGSLIKTQYSRDTCSLEGNVGLILHAGHLREKTDSSPKAISPLPSSGQELLKGSFRQATSRGRGLLAETAQSALTVILKLVIGARTSVVWIVLGTVNHDLLPLNGGLGEDS